MVFGLEDDEVLTVDEVDQSMFFGEPAGPGTGQKVAQWFGFADAGGGVRAPARLPDT